MTMRLKIQEEREEAREEGRVQGREEGALRMLTALVKDGLIDLTTAADRLNMTVEEFRVATASL